MRGPGLRLDLDVRRLWRCRTCNTERHTSGRVTSVACHFCQDHPAMTLVESPRPVRSPADPLDLVIALHPDDVDAPAFVPVHLREPSESESAARTAPPQSDPSQPASNTSKQPAPQKSAPVKSTAETTAAPSPEASESPAPRKKRRKKNRRRRRSGAGPQSGATSESDGGSSPSASSPSGGESFGAGLDPSDA